MPPALTIDPRTQAVEQHAESVYAELAARASAQGWERGGIVRRLFVPFAGITRFRFDGYHLSRYRARRQHP